MTLHIHCLDLLLRDPFTISYHSKTKQPTLIVAIQEGTHTGLGEATSNPFYQVRIEDMRQEIESLRPAIEHKHWDTPEDFYAFLETCKVSNFTRCALDEAMHDLHGKRMGKPLYALWKLDPRQQVVSSYTIGMDSIPKMEEKLAAYPWPLYKIKMGTANDMAMVEALRKKTEAVFRIDANGGWEVEEAIEKSHRLKALGVEFLEQPLKVEDQAGMKRLFKESPLPLIADESCRSLRDVEDCVGCFHGINLKLTKCGGLTPVRRMIARARALGLQVMGGCMIESSVGISALGQLVPLLDHVDMDTILLITNDPATGVRLHEKGVLYASEDGTGARLKDSLS